ncbi:MAG: DNA-deoxyinosine glycosylase [Lachnospiraceae bacterium]|nr:DNA-deoxyinosine glycosylase [Lachnospiraceae bacterium]
MERQTIVHPLLPFYRPDSRILLLGSFPSPKTREMKFFYGHPQNRMWKVLAAVFNDDVPATVEERRAFLTRHRIAMWDVLYSCEIAGASDASIRNPVPTDLHEILAHSAIGHIYTTGSTAGKYYKKFHEPLYRVPHTVLPSTSPANAAVSLEKLIGAYRSAFETDGVLVKDAAVV